MRFPMLLIVVLLIVAAPAAAQEEQAPPPEPFEAQNDITPIVDPYGYKSARGGFWVKLPSGCGALRKNFTNLPEDADPATYVDMVHIYCDQSGREGSGCAVSAIFNERGPDGEPAGPREVSLRIEEQLKRFGGSVLRQGRLQRKLDDGRVLDGLDVYVQHPDGAGEIWVRGLLEDGDIYVLVAWNNNGGLFLDPEFQDFFNSFTLIDE